MNQDLSWTDPSWSSKIIERIKKDYVKDSFWKSILFIIFLLITSCICFVILIVAIIAFAIISFAIQFFLTLLEFLLSGGYNDVIRWL